MDIERRWFADLRLEEIEQTRQREEIVIVVDLWAATTNLVLMVAKRPARLVVVDDERYPQAERTYPGAILIGESWKTPREKFISSNDPVEIERVDISGKTVLYMTNNGTKVLEAFSPKKRGFVFAGSLVNRRFLVDYLKSKHPEKVIIVAAGNLAGEMGSVQFVEDWLGAEIFEKELIGQEYDLLRVNEEIKRTVVSIYQHQTNLSPEERFWPFIFGEETDILPTAFVNSDDFVEVVDYGRSS